MLATASTDTFTTSDSCSISFSLRPAASAPRLVLIHPLALSERVWDGVAEILAGRVELLTYDCRGHGKSERRAMEFTTALFARDLAELLDHVDWPLAAIAGCSMGGCVAQAFAAKYPQRLNALGLIDTTAWYGLDAPRQWGERLKNARVNGLSGMQQFQATRWFSDTFQTRQPQVVEAIKEIFIANDVECYCSTCVMLGAADLRSSNQAIEVPVAIIVGDQDYATPVGMSRQIHETIPGSTLTILPGVRHLTPVEAPEQIASHLLGLLERVR